LAHHLLASAFAGRSLRMKTNLVIGLLGVALLVLGVSLVVVS